MRAPHLLPSARPRRRRRLRHVAAAVVLASAAVTAGGCARPAGPAPGPSVDLRVTRDYGQEPLLERTAPRAAEAHDPVALVQRLAGAHLVAGEVRSVAGASASRGERWFAFVNGLGVSGDPVRRILAPGDVVQWDLRPVATTGPVSAIVGAYPEPFRSGVQGKRLPVRLECAEPTSAACHEAGRRLASSGVPASAARAGVAAGPGLARVLVGRWAQIGRLRTAAVLPAGPTAGGFLARFTPGGDRLELLDATRRPAAVAPPPTGLIAATAPVGESVTWAITGTDEAGVLAAARSLEPRTLRDRYALAVTPRGPLALPLRGASPR